MKRRNGWRLIWCCFSAAAVMTADYDVCAASHQNEQSYRTITQTDTCTTEQKPKK